MHAPVANNPFNNVTQLTVESTVIFHCLYCMEDRRLYSALSVACVTQFTVESTVLLPILILYWTP
jgi:hypothetical protein